MNYKSLITIITVFLVGLLIGSQISEKEKTEIVEVETVNQETQDYKTENENLKNQINELNNKVSELENKNTELQNQLSLYQPKELKEEINLTSWDRNEIVKGLSNYNSKFASATWFNYIYRDDKSYYDQDGPIFDEDPFYEIKYSDRDQELTLNSLRLFNLDPGNKGIADDKYSEYKNKVLVAMQTDSNLSCSEQIICRNVKLITCLKNSNQYYSWFAIPYLFITKNDDKETLNNFESFYC